MPEINFDSLVGPTHYYGGLAYGNRASMENKAKRSNPKQAALQGLAKMHALSQLGIPQAIIPPQERPFLSFLHLLGYHGQASAILEKVYREAPNLLMIASSAASMWAANTLTVSPSIDSQDGRVHFTPANLISQIHRSFESPFVNVYFHQVFEHPAYFVHHHPLPPHGDFADEGAANHSRFCETYEKSGVQLFVYGRSGGDQTLPHRFPARQTLEASEAIQRLHRLKNGRVVFAQQNPAAIDAGVFHNDVISVGNQNVFLYHEEAFVDTEQVIAQLQQQVETVCQVPFISLRVSSSQISLDEAVNTYFFNSQLVTLPDHTMALIAPKECESSLAVQAFLQALLSQENHPIKHVHYYDLQESMQNGGGPACLRLRVALNAKELAAMKPQVLLTDALYTKLVQWINTHYRDTLVSRDLADPQLLQEVYNALDALTELLQLGPLYPFQHLRQQPNFL